MRSPQELADEALRQIDAAVPGLVLAGGDELHAVLVALFRDHSADVLAEVALQLSPDAYERARMTPDAVAQLLSTASLFRGAAARVRAGQAAWPKPKEKP
jgi:hypothetical protein